MTDADRIVLPADAALPPDLRLRRPTTDDHPRVTGVVRAWWGLPETSTLPLLLPRLFFEHFADWSLLGEDDAGLAAFLIGFRSQSRPGTAYIHFVGVRPDLRGAGLARTLYETFSAQAAAAGCTRVNAITSPANRRSQEFHRALGFDLTGDIEIDGVPAWRDYDGPGQHRVGFSKAIGGRP